MKRRKFILGAGSAAIGGSALIGSGAFSRVESQRSVSIEVAEDPDAYLGMDGCPDSPNQSYTNIDENGHLEIDMTPSNPTEDGGEGVNSDSRTWFDSVFQLCNQGKEQVCVYIEDDEDWPEVDEEDSEQFAGDRRVDFYLEGDREESIIGMENAFHLPLGDCVCVGLRTNTKGLSDGDELLEDIDETITVVADADDFCEPEPEETCEIYGIDRTDDDQFVSAITVGDGGVTDIGSVAGPLPDGKTENEPNGIAHDPFEDLFYFSVNEPEDGELATIPLGGDEDDVTLYDNFDDRAEGEISGAAFAYEGKYYYFLDGGEELKYAEIDDVGDEDSDVTVEGTGIMSPVGEITFLGDVAINRDEDTAYVSTNDPESFFKIDLDDETAEDLTDDVDENFVDKQMAYGVDPLGDPQLYATAARGGEWYELDPETGDSEEILEDSDVIGDEFTDLAHCGSAFLED